MAFVVGDLADGARLDAQAIVGKDRERSRLLVKCEVGCAECHREIRRDR